MARRALVAPRSARRQKPSGASAGVSTRPTYPPPPVIEGRRQRRPLHPRHHPPKHQFDDGAGPLSLIPTSTWRSRDGPPHGAPLPAATDDKATSMPSDLNQADPQAIGTRSA